MKVIYRLPHLKFVKDEGTKQSPQEKPSGNGPKRRLNHNKFFGQFAEQASAWAGSSIAFFLAMTFVLVWVVTGPLVNYSPHWEALIAEIPGSITFLLVFLIQNSQGREMTAVQLKLNELIRATDGAHTMMLNLEKLTEEELTVLCEQYEILAQEARKRMKHGESDKGVSDIPEPAKAVEAVAEAIVNEVEQEIENVMERVG